MTGCDRFKDAIWDYVDGLLPTESRKNIEKHLKECTVCLTGHADAKALRSRLKSLRPLKTSANFETILRTRISMERSLRRRSILDGPMRFPAYVTAAALLILAAVFGANLKQSNTLSPQPSQFSVNSNPEGANSEQINYPVDVLDLSRRGTSLDSDAPRRAVSSRSDSTRNLSRERIRTVEF